MAMASSRILLSLLILASSFPSLGSSLQQQQQQQWKGATTVTSVPRREVSAPAAAAAPKQQRRRQQQRAPSPATTAPEPSYRSYCPRCDRPAPVCLCHALPPGGPIDAGSAARVLILQHPAEARRRKRTSTVPLIGLCVRDVEICRGASFAEDCCPALGEALDDPSALLLYPGEGAVPLEEFVREEEESRRRRDAAAHDDAATRASPSSSRNGKSRLLIAVDGTWAQTQAIIRASPCLSRLPRVMFADAAASLFDPIRREPAGHCTSTLEAVSRALRIVGTTNDAAAAASAAAAADAMEDALRAMVDGQLRYALNPEDARPRYKRDDGAKEKPPAGVGGGTGGGAPGRRRRKSSPRRRGAQLALRPTGPRTAEEAERDRVRFIYVAHLG